jgi:hypothetical protein
MRAEPSKLARLVIAYHERFGEHAPDSALRRVDGRVLAAMLEDALATSVPIAEAELAYSAQLKFRLGGCTIREERTKPTKGPGGEWLQ